MMFAEYLGQRGLHGLLTTPDNSEETFCVQIEGRDSYVTVHNAQAFADHMDDYDKYTRNHANVLDNRYHVKETSPHSRELIKNFQQMNVIRNVIRERSIIDNHTETLRSWLNSL